jgi:hypothetical protein
MVPAKTMRCRTGRPVSSQCSSFSNSNINSLILVSRVFRSAGFLIPVWIACSKQLGACRAMIYGASFTYSNTISVPSYGCDCTRPDRCPPWPAQVLWRGIVLIGHRTSIDRDFSRFCIWRSSRKSKSRIGDLEYLRDAKYYSVIIKVRLSI